jgi:hypothetical protein
MLILRPDSWDTTRQLSLSLPRWAFRGQQDAVWGLDTTLHRAALQFGFIEDLLEARELWMLRHFQRRAHHYLADPPSLEQRLEWLALIQHYGGPTRLLDFTHSFYVAAFFGLERAAGDVAIWAVNLDALEAAIVKKKKLRATKSDENVDATNTRLIKLAESYIGRGAAENLVLHVEPDRLNERLSIQQGLFLFPCNVSSSFADNLAATFDLTADDFQQVDETPISRNEVKSLNTDDESIIKIVVPRRSRRMAFDDLQAMNITSATLFPGLDGFARSLYYHLGSVSVAGDDEYFDRFK